MKTNRERAEEAYRQLREFPYVASRGVACIEIALDEAVREAVEVERAACIADLNATAAWDRPTSVFRGVVIDVIRARGAK